MIVALLLVVLAYLLGSLSSAVVICRLFGLPDPRTSGSGNPGATNVLRLGGKKAAAMTLVADMLKGLLPTLAAQIADVPLPWVATIGLASVVGHMFPVFFSFRGGKGVATGLGTLLGIHWVTGLLAIAVWLATCLVFRISSLAALVTFVAVPLLFVVNGRNSTAMVLAIMSVLLFWRHRENIKRLLRGEEPKLGRRKKPQTKPQSTDSE